MNQTQSQEKPSKEIAEAERDRDASEEEVNPNVQSQALQRTDQRMMQGPPRLLSDDFYGTWYDEQRRWEMQQNKSQDMFKEDTLRLRLDLNLDLEVKLRAHLHGDLTLALL